MTRSATSIWTMKPWWCQPWSIVLTGITIPTALWLLSHRWWLVVPVGAAVLLWWFLFLYLVPRQYAAQVATLSSPGTSTPANPPSHTSEAS